MKKICGKIFIIIFVLITFSISFFSDESIYSILKNSIFNNELRKINKKNDFVVTFIDVGQAESILIKSDDEYMLIDAGNNSDGEKLVKFLKSLNINKFKYVVATHPHEDHIGGMDDVINNFKIDYFYMTDAFTSAQSFLDVLDSLEDNNYTYYVPYEGMTLELGDSKIEVISASSEQEDLNDTSIVLKLVYKDVSFLFTGDITNNVERMILDKDIESTVLKVAHHGSKYSNSAVFLNKVKPKYAVISCGENNDYYHPHKVVLDKLTNLGTEIYRTDLLGTIVAISDGENIEFVNIETDTDGDVYDEQ